MILLLLFFISLELLLGFRIREVFQSSSVFLQDFCVLQFHGERLSPLGGALVCGRDLSDSSLKSLFIDTGIYHVLVVSGAHLALLVFWFQFFCHKISTRPSVRFFVSLGLFFYALITGLQAPVVRALIQYLMIQNNPARLRPADVLTSYIYCLAFEPRWWSSLSLQLSTVATLAFIVPLPSLRRNFLIYFMLLPLLLPLGLRSPLVVLIATMIAPVLELLLLPIFLLTLFIRPLQPVVDHSLAPLLVSLENMRDSLPPMIVSNAAWSPFCGPLYVLSCWLIAEHLCSRSARRWHFESPPCTRS